MSQPLPPIILHIPESLLVVPDAAPVCMCILPIICIIWPVCIESIAWPPAIGIVWDMGSVPVIGMPAAISMPPMAIPSMPICISPIMSIIWPIMVII